jgi:hypothetical protein
MGRKDKSDKNGETISSGSSKVVRVSLNEQVLRDALDIYLDETKPDPLVRQQLADSSWSWKEESTDSAVSAVAELLEEATHYLAGTATWSGAYASVDLRVRTCWKANNKKSSDADGSLVSVCHASARLGASTSSSSPSKKDKKDKKEKAEEKIASKMVKRLGDDAYITKWLLEDGVQEEPSLLYEAHILLQKDSAQLEERVDTSPDVGEAIRRAVFSSAEDSMDVLEVVFCFPWLPAVKHAPALLKKKKTTALADRARLRLLEDAMCDACEQQGEEVMVQDLDIRAKKSKLDE